MMARQIILSLMFLVLVHPLQAETPLAVDKVLVGHLLVGQNGDGPVAGFRE